MGKLRGNWSQWNLSLTRLQRLDNLYIMLAQLTMCFTYRQDVASHIVVSSHRRRRTVRSRRPTSPVCIHATPSAITSSSVCRPSASASLSSTSTSKELLPSTTHFVLCLSSRPDYPLCRLYHGRPPRRKGAPADQLPNFYHAVLTFERNDD